MRYIFLFLSIILVVSCEKVNVSKLEMMPVPVLNVKVVYGVNTAFYLPVQEKPTSRSQALSILRDGEIFKILETKEVNLQWRTVYWYLIEKENHEIGWVDSSEVKPFDSLLQAKTASVRYIRAQKLEESQAINE